MTGYNKLGWDQVAGESASHFPTNEQIIRSSVKLCLHALLHKTVLQSFDVLDVSKMCLSFIKNNFNAFDAFWGTFIFYDW